MDDSFKKKKEKKTFASVSCVCALYIEVAKEKAT